MRPALLHAVQSDSAAAGQQLPSDAAWLTACIASGQHETQHTGPVEAAEEQEELCVMEVCYILSYVSTYAIPPACCVLCGPWAGSCPRTRPGPPIS